MKSLIPFLLIPVFIACRPQVVSPPQPLLPLPSESQLAWHEMELNAFVHFTTNTFSGKEWGYGDEDPNLFNPTDFDADQWLQTFKESGFQGVILTCKHHDGFCLWPSAYTDHSVKNSTWQNGKGDVAKAVSEACKKYGLKFGIYLSPWDRNHKDYGKPEYITYYRNQLNELLSAYGPVFEMWFDGANGGDGYYGGAREKRKIDGKSYYDWPNTLQLVREKEPQIIFFSDAGPGVRWVGNERGVAGETNWCTISTDTLYAGKSGIQELLNTGMENGSQWVPAETDVSIRPGWFYHPEQDSLVKSPEKLFDIYLTSVGRGSTLLLNIPPDQRGLIHPKDVSALKGFKKLRDSVFQFNLALHAKVTATSQRGNHADFSPSNMIDNNPKTYWATDDEVKKASFEITLPKPETVNYVVLQEYISLGQRVKSFRVEAFQHGNWKTLAEGTTIGYKRILKIEPTMTDQLRIQILDAKACPLISQFEIY